MLIDNLKSAYLKARKEKNEIARSVLSTLIGDIETKQKMNPKFGDFDVIAMCKRMIENNSATIALGVPNAAVLVTENDILQQFLPKQLDDGEIHVIIESNLTGSKLPEIMKFFKENFAGCYDGKRLSEIAKEYVK